MTTGISKKERRAISGILQVILIVAIVIIAAASLAVFALDLVDTGTIMDSVEVGKMSLSKAGGDTYVAATIQNNGNTAITSASIQVQIDTDSATAGIQPFTTVVSGAPFEPGETFSVYQLVVDSSNTAISMTTGDTYHVIINAVSATGSTVTDPIKVRVR